MIYDVAMQGGMGTVEQIEQSKIYDFVSYLSYLKAKDKYTELGLKRSANKSKGRGKR